MDGKHTEGRHVVHGIDAERLSELRKELKRAQDDWMRVERMRAAAPELLDVAIDTRALVAEAAMTGFNWQDGDWTERLFANQARLSAAIRSATFQPSPAESTQ